MGSQCMSFIMLKICVIGPITLRSVTRWAAYIAVICALQHSDLLVREAIQNSVTIIKPCSDTNMYDCVGGIHWKVTPFFIHVSRWYEGHLNHDNNGGNMFVIVVSNSTYKFPTESVCAMKPFPTLMRWGVKE